MPSNLKSAPAPAKYSPLSFARMLWKWRRMVLVCWIISTTAAILVVRKLPPLYKSEALVLVDSQKIPEAFVSSTVEGELPDRLAMISQSIMSRTRLLEIIQGFQLYKKERTSKTEEEIIQEMRKDISVKVEHSWTGGKMAAFRARLSGAKSPTSRGGRKSTRRSLRGRESSLPRRSGGRHSAVSRRSTRTGKTEPE